MKQVASLRYGVIFKKAFCDVEIFKAFVKDFLDIDLEIDKVETEKSFTPLIGNVDSRFDLYAEDKKNRVIVDIQHRYYNDHYDRFLHYHCAAMLEQISNAKSYTPELQVFTIVVLTSNNAHKSAFSTIYFDPIDYVTGKGLGEIAHKIVYLSPKHISEKIPAPYQEWLMAIEDSLDEKVDEHIYHKPEILKVLKLIEKEGLTPQDRAQIKDEYALESALQKEKKAEYQKGRHEEKLEIARNMQAQGLSLELIAHVTGLDIETLPYLK